MTTLKDITDRQDLILLAEIGALIHDLGKLSREFIVQQSAECLSSRAFRPECNFDHEQILRDPGFLGPSLVNLLQDPRWRPRLQANAVTQLRQAPEHLAHFVPGHTNLRSGVGLLALVTRCDQVDSGVDKGALQSSAKQSWSTTYKASAFGYEDVLPVDPAQDGLKVRRDELAAVLRDSLQRVLSNRTTPEERTDILKATESAFRQALGETRRAANDVTLWDHAYSVAGLQKAVLAQVLVKDAWPSDLRQLQWRILRVVFNGFQFLENAHRIPDLLGRLQVLQGAMDNVRTLLETTLPLGNEIYRDENGSAFIVPDVSNLLDLEDDQGKTLRERIMEEFCGKLSGEVRLDLSNEWFSDPSRYGIELGRLLSKPLSPLASDPQLVCNQWSTHGSVEVCTVCGLRPQGPSAKARDRGICDICKQRRINRARQWASNLATTVWTDEVADSNGRLALIVAHFDLTAWLNGRLLSSILAQEPPAGKTYEVVVGQLAEELRKNVQPVRSNQPLLQQLAPEAFRQDAQAFYKAVVEERDIHGLAAGIAEDDYRAKAERLLFFLLRKNPSFARLRRVWETTRRFWQEVAPTDEDSDVPLEKSLVGEKVKQAGSRLEVQGTLQPKQSGDTPGDYHTCELVLPGGVKMSVVWDADKHRFITVDNLDYLSGAGQLGRPVQEVLKQGAILTLEEPVGYGGKNKVWGTITVESVNELPGEYTPAIPILAEPRTFMALVPADKALDVAYAIKTKYEREMGKVRNRLPLTVGIVYGGRRTPLRAILDAGRRMLQQQPLGGQEVWTVQADATSGALPNPKKALAEGTQQFQQTISIQLAQDGRSLTWHVPAVMGDGTTEDVWYPYVFLETDVEPTDRSRRFQAPNPWTGQDGWLVHAGELRRGDQVYFTPATLDWVWLDTTGRRFEIAYDEQGQRRGLPRRPYLLDELETIEQIWEALFHHLSSTQVHALSALVEAKRAAWEPGPEELQKDGMFWQFCHDAVANTGWQKGRNDDRKDKMPWEVEGKSRHEWLDTWADHAAPGRLADVVELYIQIMKQEPGHSENEEVKP